jgi:hypothetical protein
VAEKALVSFKEQDRKLAERLGVTADELARSRPTERTDVYTAIPAPRTPDRARATNGAGATDREPLARRRRIGVLPLVVAGLLVLLLTGVGYGAYVFLPTATITLEPQATHLSPPAYSVVADPNVAVADVVAGVVPAQWLEIPLTVTGTFAATGVEARETRATGVVRFRSENTLNAVAILEGTVVSTADGVDFETTQPVSVPRADFQTSTPGSVDAPIRAVRPGTRGNVPADAITEVPASLEGQLVSVRNPDPTDGGRREEENVVAQADYDTALTSLTTQLSTQLDAELADPATAPRGLTLFPESATVGEPQPDTDAVEVVGLPGPSFTLTVESVGTVLAVNETLVDELAEARVRAELFAGQRLVDDAVRTTHTAGALSGETVAYQATATATVYSEPDRQQVVAQLRGKSVTEAERILVTYGMVEISMWPEFVDRLPDQTARINLIVVAPSAAPTLAPSPAPSPRP